MWILTGHIKQCIPFDQERHRCEFLSVLSFARFPNTCHIVIERKCVDDNISVYHPIVEMFIRSFLNSNASSEAVLCATAASPVVVADLDRLTATQRDRLRRIFFEIDEGEELIIGFVFDHVDKSCIGNTMSIDDHITSISTGHLPRIIQHCEIIQQDRNISLHQ